MRMRAQTATASVVKGRLLLILLFVSLHYFRTCTGNFDGGGDWYPGKIVAIRGGHQHTGGGGRVTYDIVYDDGR